MGTVFCLGTPWQVQDEAVLEDGDGAIFVMNDGFGPVKTIGFRQKLEGITMYRPYPFARKIERLDRLFLYCHGVAARQRDQIRFHSRYE
jgi:hypothetical protein